MAKTSKKKPSKKAVKTIKTDDLPKINFGQAIRTIIKAKKNINPS